MEDKEQKGHNKCKCKWTSHF